MKKYSQKLLALVLACALLCALPGGSAWGAETAESTTAAETTTDKAAENAKKDQAKKSLEQQQKELQKSIEESEKKLAELGKSSKVTQDYVDTLDQKIGAMNDRLTVLQAQVDESQKAIDTLKPQIAANKKQLDALQKEVDAGQKELNKLNDRFEATYQAYCYRLRVMYISGEYSIITALLGCKDISGFLTRYEMIKAVSKSDTELLQEVNGKMEEICSKQNGLNQQKAQYQKVKKDLDEKNKTLKAKQAAIERDQEGIAASKVTLAQDRAESDALLAQLTAQNRMYTEYRNEDEKLQQQVESEIDALISGLKNADEVTTLSKKDKEHTTSKNNTAGGKAQGVYSHSDAALNMTYPVPGHYTVSAGFPQLLQRQVPRWAGLPLRRRLQGGGRPVRGGDYRQAAGLQLRLLCDDLSRHRQPRPQRGDPVRPQFVYFSGHRPNGEEGSADRQERFYRQFHRATQPF